VIEATAGWAAVSRWQTVAGTLQDWLWSLDTNSPDPPQNPSELEVFCTVQTTHEMTPIELFDYTENVALWITENKTD